MKKKLLGLTLIALPFIAGYAAAVSLIGWYIPTVAYGILAVISGCIFGGVFLMS